MDVQEVDLVLVGRVRGVRGRLLHAEVIVQTSRPKVGCGLRDQLSSPHIGVPESCRVDGDLDTLSGDRVGRVLVGWREIDIIRHWPRAVNVVLVRTNLVSPRPVVKICAG